MPHPAGNAATKPAPPEDRGTQAGPEGTPRATQPCAQGRTTVISIRKQVIMETTLPEQLIHNEELEIQHDRTVREEIEIFRRKAEAFLAGEITEDDFRP